LELQICVGFRFSFFHLLVVLFVPFLCLMFVAGEGDGGGPPPCCSFVPPPFFVFSFLVFWLGCGLLCLSLGESLFHVLGDGGGSLAALFFCSLFWWVLCVPLIWSTLCGVDGLQVQFHLCG
jgi:hypothetical protein